MRRRRRNPQLGTWVKLPSLETVEILALCGYDFVVVDGEHSPLTLESVYRSIALGQALGMQVLVRVADRSGETVQRVLDAGADGILIPQVANASVASEVTRRMIFSSYGGTRGMGATSRAGWWGLASAAEYVEHGRTQLARVIQLESAEALARVEEILDVPTVNAALIGLGDLTLSTGRRPVGPGHPGHGGPLRRRRARTRPALRHRGRERRGGGGRGRRRASTSC